MRVILALMAIYLAIMAGLAIKYDWHFFMNDALALSLFAVFLVGLWIVQGPHHRPR